MDGVLIFGDGKREGFFRIYDPPGSGTGIGAVNRSYIAVSRCPAINRKFFRPVVHLDNCLTLIACFVFNRACVQPLLGYRTGHRIRRW